MTNLDTEIEIDWMGCELIEQIPGKVSSRPTVRGTRILPDASVGSHELGKTIEELHESFLSLTVAQIRRLIQFGLDQLKQRSIEPLRTL